MRLHRLLVVFLVFTFLPSVVLPSVVLASDQIRLVAFGDSLTAGYDLDQADGFVLRLEAALKDKGYDVLVLDAGVSGDTTSGGLARLDWSVGPDADAVILELGGNDMLRGIDPAEIRKNMAAMAARLKERGLPTLIAGMLAAPNLGEEYQAAFDPIFKDVAKDYGMLYYPFFLEGIAGKPEYLLPDGLHPNEIGVDVIVKNILPSVEALIERVKDKQS